MNMSTMLKKEMRLSTMLLTYLFIGFAFMTLIPGYPILCGVFFITLGIFKSFENAREMNDIVFSALLPVAKTDVVKGKYLMSLFIELSGFAIMAVLTLLRMTALADAEAYRQNALMNANLFYLGASLLIFGEFNAVFIGGFFKTAYKIGKHFVIYIIIAFLTIGLAESLHHVPGLGGLNAFGSENMGLQFVSLIAGCVAFALLTYLSYKKACRDFERIDL